MGLLPFSLGQDLHFSLMSRAQGGEIRNKPSGMIRGKGTGRSDSIPTMLSNGEFVINAAATKKYRALLEQINAGGLLHRANGGIVGSVPTMPALPTARALQEVKERGRLRVDVNPSPLFDVKVREVADGRIERASPALVKQAVEQSDSRFARNFQDSHNRSLL